MPTSEFEQPAIDEVEVSIFGPGYGEAILIHLGAGEWVAIDSCINPLNGDVVPLAYLTKIGVALDTCLLHVIATHWHDDHIRGLSNILTAAPKATFFCPGAFTKKEFLYFAVANATADPSTLGNATREVVDIMSLVRDRRKHPRYVARDRLLLKKDAPIPIKISSLSPDDDRIGEFLRRISAATPLEHDTRRRAQEFTPNDISVAILIESAAGSMLLGADLEEERLHAWTSIVVESQCHAGVRAGAFKIPHHGSANGHCDKVWTELLDENPIAVLTPWRLGGQHLPQKSDIARILSLTPHAYSTAAPGSLAPTKLNSRVRKSLSERNIKLSLAHPRVGHIRLRRKVTESAWRIEKFGTAIHLNHL